MAIRFDDPVKQEIWDALRALNDAWTRGNPDDLKNYFHRDMVLVRENGRWWAVADQFSPCPA